MNCFFVCFFFSFLFFLLSLSQARNVHNYGTRRNTSWVICSPPSKFLRTEPRPRFMGGGFTRGTVSHVMQRLQHRRLIMFRKSKSTYRVLHPRRTALCANYTQIWPNNNWHRSPSEEVWVSDKRRLCTRCLRLHPDSRSFLILRGSWTLLSSKAWMFWKIIFKAFCISFSKSIFLFC